MPRTAAAVRSTATVSTPAQTPSTALARLQARHAWFEQMRVVANAASMSYRRAHNGRPHNTLEGVEWFLCFTCHHLKARAWVLDPANGPWGDEPEAIEYYKAEAARYRGIAMEGLRKRGVAKGVAEMMARYPDPSARTAVA